MDMRTCGRGVLVALMVLVATGGDDPMMKPAAAKRQAATASLSPERREAALGFVRRELPELARLLERLEPMSPGEYAKAVREIDQVHRMLENARKRDPKRYERGLAAWKARSRVDLLAAQLASIPAGDERRSEVEENLRSQLERQLDADLALKRHDEARIAAQLQRTRQAIERLESQRASWLESRMNSLVQRGRNARKTPTGQRAKTTPAPATDGGSAR